MKKAVRVPGMVEVEVEIPAGGARPGTWPLKIRSRACHLLGTEELHTSSVI